MQAGRISVALRERLGEQGTVGLLELVDSSGREWKEDVLTSASERFERRLTEEISGLRLEMSNGFAALRIELREGLANVRVDLIKWSFVFWIGQLVALSGVMAFMLRLAD
jgi:hypothetical protein